MTTRLLIDRDACAGHGLCYGSAPTILDCDEQGDPVLLRDPLPDDVGTVAERAVSMCPERALSLHRDDGPSGPPR